MRRIKNDPLLSLYIEDDCCENGVCVTIEGGILPENYAIIKVDKYYNAQRLGNTPASVDCLIIRKCVNGGYGLTLVELKDIYSGSRFSLENLREKFETSLNDFIKMRFREVLDLDYKDVKLYFVSRQEIYKRDIGLKLEFLMETKVKFNDKLYMIRPMMPTPTIKNCY